MSLASQIFNALPKETRLRCCPSMTETQINQLNHEKDRLSRSHKRSIREINDHIKNLERSRDEQLAEIKAATATEDTEGE